jgi:Protein of unknown function (DUF968)
MYYNKRFRNANYLSWIRTQPCVVTDMDFTQTDMVAHHVRLGGDGGMGLKPSDYRCIPLTAFQHVKLHAMVESEYYKMFELSVEKLMISLMIKYIRTQRGIGIGDNLALRQLEEFIDLQKNMQPIAEYLEKSHEE